jgi:hypothetical protein
LSILQQERWKETIKSFPKTGKIERTVTDSALPIVIVKKKNVCDRVCVDYCELIMIICHDPYPSPGIDTILIKMLTFCVLTKIDMSSAYHQIRIEDNSEKYTAI